MSAVRRFSLSRRFSRLLPGILLLAAFGVGANPPEVSEEDLNAVLEELNSIKTRLGKDMSRYSKLDKSFRETEREIGKLAREQRQLTVEQKQLQQQIGRLDRKQRELKAKQAQQQDLAAEQLRLAYQLGNQNALQQLFQQSDPGTVGRQLSYLDYANTARVERINAYLETIRETRLLGEEIQQKKARLDQNIETLAAQRSKMQQLQSRREQQLTSLRGDIKSQEQRITELQADSEQLRKLLEEVQRTLSQRRAVSPDGKFASLQGALAWPVEGKLRYRFGTRRPNSDINWQGVTISANSGSPVKAIYPGRVVFADWFKGQGLLLIIDHGDGYMSLYSHNESLLRDTGAWVDAGETIATVGNSGGQTASALYFEIRHNGVPRNPAKWCS